MERRIPNLGFERLSLWVVFGIVAFAATPRLLTQYSTFVNASKQADLAQYQAGLQVARIESRAWVEEQVEELATEFEQLPAPAESGFRVEVLQGYTFDWSIPPTITQEWLDWAAQFGDVQVWSADGVCIGHAYEGKWYSIQPFPKICETGAKAMVEQVEMGLPEFMRNQ